MGSLSGKVNNNHLLFTRWLLMQISCTQKATQVKGGKELKGEIWASELFSDRNINSKLFWANKVNLYWSYTPLKIVQWIFAFDFRIWNIIDVLNY